MLPLSFSEFCRLKNSSESKENLFDEYLRDGVFPYVTVMDKSIEKIDMYLEGIYNTVIVKYIKERQNRRERDSDKRKITDT